MRGTVKIQSFVISSIKLSFKYKIAEQKPSVLFYGEIRWTKLNTIEILPYYSYNPKAKLR
jgi:hypothetical protein